MPYIGNTIRAADDYRLIDDISSGFNGSETSFALQVAGSAPVPFPKSPQQVLISVNGVIQEPDPTGSSGFNLVGTNIVFSSAPTNGHAFFGIIYATADYLNAGGNFPAGSLGAPSITFIGDENTGLFRKSGGSVGFVSDATEIANFDSNGITISSGNIIIPDSIIHNGDTNTKIRFPATDTVTVETSGSERLRVDSSGNIGIGIATAQRILHQHVSTSDGNGHQFTNSTTGSGSTDGLVVGINADESSVFWNHEDTDIKIATNNTERIRIKNDALVGINVDDPLELVHMKGNLFITLNGSSANEGNGIKFQTKTGGFTTSYGAAIFGKRVGDTSSYLRFDTGGQSEKMRLDSSGRLLIGTTTEGASTADDLTIATTGNTGITLRSGTASNGNIFFSDGTSGDDELRGYIQYDHSTNGLNFGTDRTTRVVINSSGHVGIGINSPGQLLHLSRSSTTAYSPSSTANDTTLMVQNTGAAGHATIEMQVKSSGTSQTGQATIGAFTEAASSRATSLTFGTRNHSSAMEERMRIDSEGRLLIAKGTANTTTSQVQIGDHAGGYSWDVGDTPQVLIAGINNEAPTNGGALNIAFRVQDENSSTVFQISNNGGGDSDIGRVGIGTGSPDRQLHVEGNGTAIIRLTDNDTTGEVGSIIGMLEFETRDSNNAGVAANIRSEISDTTNGACKLAFSTGTPTTIGTKMELNSSGALTIAAQPCAVVTDATSATGLDNGRNGTPITFQSTHISQGGMTLSNTRSRITVAFSGTYLVTANISGDVATTQAGDGIIFRLRRNGANYPTDASHPAESFGNATGQEWAFNFILPVNLSANDYIEVCLDNIGTVVNFGIGRGYFSATLMH